MVFPWAGNGAWKGHYVAGGLFMVSQWDFKGWSFHGIIVGFEKAAILTDGLFMGQ